MSILKNQLFVQLWLGVYCSSKYGCLQCSSYSWQCVCAKTFVRVQTLIFFAKYVHSLRDAQNLILMPLRDNNYRPNMNLIVCI